VHLLVIGTHAESGSDTCAGVVAGIADQPDRDPVVAHRKTREVVRLGMGDGDEEHVAALGLGGGDDTRGQVVGGAAALDEPVERQDVDDEVALEAVGREASASGRG
jgi:hypothetical protein